MSRRGVFRRTDDKRFGMRPVDRGESGWQFRAACGDYDSELWFDPTAERQARRICRQECPVMGSCLAYALALQPDGIWADTDARQRKAILKRRVAA